jgi:hypothetical protein
MVLKVMNPPINNREMITYRIARLHGLEPILRIILGAPTWSCLCKIALLSLAEMRPDPRLAIVLCTHHGRLNVQAMV